MGRPTPTPNWTISPCQPGSDITLATLHLLETVSAQRWYQFTSSAAQQYLVLASSSQIDLYVWRGIFTPVQVSGLLTDGLFLKPLVSKLATTESEGMKSVCVDVYSTSYSYHKPGLPLMCWA